MLSSCNTIFSYDVYKTLFLCYDIDKENINENEGG